MRGIVSVSNLLFVQYATRSRNDDGIIKQPIKGIFYIPLIYNNLESWKMFGMSEIPSKPHSSSLFIGWKNGPAVRISCRSPVPEDPGVGSTEDRLFEETRTGIDRDFHATNTGAAGFIRWKDQHTNNRSSALETEKTSGTTERPEGYCLKRGSVSEPSSGLLIAVIVRLERPFHRHVDVLRLFGR